MSLNFSRTGKKTGNTNIFDIHPDQRCKGMKGGRHETVSEFRGRVMKREGLTIFLLPSVTSEKTLDMNERCQIGGLRRGGMVGLLGGSVDVALSLREQCRRETKRKKFPGYCRQKR